MKMTEQPADPCTSVELIQGLYRSWQGYAETLTSEQLRLLHISTPIEDYVGDCLAKGWDVVLTGNPGDGKTHLMMWVRERDPSLEKVEWIIDATAVESDGSSPTGEETIYKDWLARRKKGIPTCLAINQGVLREMIRTVPGSPLLAEVSRQLTDQIFYLDDQAPASPKESVVVLDLDKRSPLEPQFFARILENLLEDKFYGECPTCPHRIACAVPRNRDLLRSATARERVTRVMALVGRSGFHATMRDVQGLVAYMITGGKDCADHIRDTELLGSRFYDLLYTGRGPLFDAARNVFDPARTSDPLIDDELWTGTYADAGWDEANELQPSPNTAGDDRRSRRAFASAKRSFYFNQPDGGRLEQYIAPADQEFFELLELSEKRRGETARRLVRVINGFFAPNPEAQELRIWNRHHFDVPPSRVYMSTRTLRSRSLIAALPKPAEWQAPVGGFQVDHVLLHAVEDGHVLARLRVDQKIYRGLSEADEGQPFPLRSPELIKALETFLSRIGASVADADDVVEIFVESLRSGRSFRFKVDVIDRRYTD